MGESYYHAACFTCTECHASLSKGRNGDVDDNDDDDNDDDGGGYDEYDDDVDMMVMVMTMIPASLQETIYCDRTILMLNCVTVFTSFEM